MPTHYGDTGGSRVADLFRARMAQRRGDTADYADLDAYGESLGVARLGGQGAAAPQSAPQTGSMGAREPMPGRPVTEGVPQPSAGDATSQVAPPNTAAAPRAATIGTQAAPTAGSTRTGIPALDALSEMPRKRSRGLVHDRQLGRVMKTGM